MPKEIVVLGGPNGAGKTTTARVLLPRIGFDEFVNADDIARALSPHDVERAAVPAGRAMIERMNLLLKQGKSLAFETTCSGLGHVAFLNRARQQGWQVFLLFVWLSSPELAVQRVALRVSRGGHNIPEHLVRRRYAKGVVNLRQSYLPIADAAAVYDNSTSESKLIAERTSAGLRVRDLEVWSRIQTAAA